MNILLAYSYALCPLTSVSFAQQPPAPPTNPAAKQAQPPQPVLSLTPVPEVINSPANESSATETRCSPHRDLQAQEKQNSADMMVIAHHHRLHRRRPPIFGSRTARRKSMLHARITSRPKSVRMFLMKIMDKLSPSSDAQDDEQD